MKRIVQAIVGICILVVCVVLAAPLLLSSERVKSTIEKQLSDVTGSSVALGGTSSLSFSPYLGVSYRDVSFSRDSKADSPFIHVGGLKARIGLSSIFSGSPSLSEVRLIRPQFDLRIDKDGQPNWWSKDGPLARRMVHVEDANEVAEEPLKLSRLELEDAQIKWRDDRSQISTEFTSVNGYISWQRTDLEASSELTGIWRGDAVEVSLRVPAFMETLKGGKSAMTASIKSTPLTAAFDGTIDTSVVAMAKGQLELNVPSPRRLNEWLEGPQSLANLFETVQISGEVDASSSDVKMEEATVSIGSHEATGRLQLGLPEDGKPSITGTLAFETIAFETLPKFFDDAANDEEVSNLPSFEDLYLDLRLSAKSLSVPGLDASNAAGTLIIKDGVASIDVGQAESLGGVVAGTLTVGGNQQPSLGIDTRFTDINMEEFSALFHAGDISISGKGAARLKLSSKTKSADSILARLNGEGRVEGSNGKIIGLNIEEVIARNKDEQASSSPNIFFGETSYDELEIDFFVANGVAHFSSSGLTTPDFKARFIGRSDLADRTLALRGDIKTATDSTGEEETVSIPFFVGGTTTEPLFIPITGPLHSP